MQILFKVAQFWMLFNTVSAAPKQAKPFKPKIVIPQASKTKKTSAQEIQRQKVQSNAVKSKPKTTSLPRSSVSASVGKNQSNPSSINQTEKRLDPFSFEIKNL